MSNFRYSHMFRKMFRVVVFCLGLNYALGDTPYILREGNYDLSSMPYIVQGEVAEDGKYPYQASMFLPSGKFRIHICGASILTKNWVMSAAHCCTEHKFSILVGTNTISTGGQAHKVGTYIKHPKYSQKGWVNDICLMKLTTPIEFNSRTQPVILPPQGKELQDGDFITVTGWGHTMPDQSDQVPDKLQVGKNFKFLALKKCANLTNMPAFEGYLCVLGNREGQGICIGDSGGPIAKDGVQYGIASFIYLPCGNPMPDFFARVANYIDWIKETLGPDAKDLKFSK